MRWRVLLIPVLVFCLANPGLGASEASVKKVLLQLLDRQGRNALHPSLFDRDAYQALLRKRPAEQSGVRFYVQWSTAKAHRTGLILRVELRGTRTKLEAAPADEFKSLSIDTPITGHGWFSNWSEVTLDGDRFKDFGQILAWRASLWDGNRMLAEQKSFLW